MRVVADQRSLRGVAATLTWQPVDGIGALASVGTVTVAVTRDFDGSVVTAGAVSGSASGERSTVIAATATQTLDVLTAVWSVGGVATATTTCEIVSGYYATLPQILERQPKAPQDTVAIDRVRAEVEAEFESPTACNVAFVPRYARRRIWSHGHGVLELPDVYLRVVRSVTVEYGTATTVFSEDECEEIQPNAAGLAYRASSCWPWGWVDIVYEHGYDRPSQRVVRAFLDRLAERMSQRNSAISPRAMSIVQDGSTTQLATPGRGQWITGNPEVDVVLFDERVPRPRIG